MSRRERKVVTVLFADLVGFTSRAERLDPEDVEAILRPYHDQLRSELERHGGTVEKFIGDAVMAVFGAPLAHDDDPERAVRAALAIRDAMADTDLDIRIGVNTGEALVTVDAHPAAGEGMVAGDVVNTAARLQAAAPPDAVYAGEATYHATERSIEYGEPRMIEAKGKATPLRIWPAVQARSRVELDARAPRSPLVGRKRELAILVDALARVREERSPQLVTLVGEPGIGKSRLLHELFQRIEADKDLIWWRHGRSLPYGEGVSLWALSEMVKNHAGILETDSPEIAEAKLRAAVAGMPEPQWLEQHLRPLVGLGGKVDIAADQRGEAFVAWRRFFETLAEERPLVLVFEDLQWADEALLDFADQLVDRAAGVPILIVATARPELLARRGDWGGGKRNSTTLSLTPLSERETAELIGHLLERSTMAAATKERMLARAGGNPLYAEEFALMFAERGAEGEVPDTVQGVIAARLDGLESADKALLQHAAVVGKIFWLGAVEAMHERPRGEIEERLYSLARMGFVRRELRASVAGDTEYAFLHVLVRDVAYGQIPRAERADLHLAAARWIDALGRPGDSAEMLAHHYAQALDYMQATGRDVAGVREAARLAFAAAGDRSFALSALAPALAYYQKALELWPAGAPERSALVLKSTYCVFLQDRSDIAALSSAHGELIAAGDTRSAAEVGALISWAAWSRGEHDRAVSTLRDSVAALRDAPSTRSKAVVLHELARVTALAGSPDALATVQAALDAAVEAGERDIEARALNTRGLARVNLGDEAGIDDLRRSLELAKEAHSPMDVCRAYINLGSELMGLGDIRAGYQCQVEGSAAAELWGLGPQRRWLRATRSQYEYEYGWWDEALTHLNEFLAEVEGGSPHYLEAQARAGRALMRVARGDVSAAAADVDLLFEADRAVMDPQALIPNLSIAAFVSLQAGLHREAESRFKEAIGLCGRTPSGIFLSPPELAFTASGLRREADYLDLVEEHRPWRWVDAAIAFVRGDTARAAEIYQEIGSLPSEAYALLVGDSPAGIERAIEFYRGVAAKHYLAVGEERLRRAASPRS